LCLERISLHPEQYGEEIGAAKSLPFLVEVSEEVAAVVVMPEVVVDVNVDLKMLPPEGNAGSTTLVLAADTATVVESAAAAPTTSRTTAVNLLNIILFDVFFFLFGRSECVYTLVF
jgi:hypothetical protein